LAAWDLKIKLPSKPKPWWETFISSAKSEELATAANLILGLGKTNDTEPTNKDTMLATIGFVRSMLPEGEEGRSFNDCDSFLWDHQKEVMTGDS
jgi:hypothetical protein